MLRSPHQVVIGTNDIEAQARWWEALGFTRRLVDPLPAEAAHSLYGLIGVTEQLEVFVPGAASGSIRLVHTPHEQPMIGPWDRGPHAIDLYTSDIGRSLDVSSAAGARIGGRLSYAYGALSMEEGKTVGPDNTVLVFVNISKRRPSLLDSSPTRLHSEVHSVVNIVADVDEAGALWTGAAGLQKLADAVIDTPGLADLMDLPKPVAARMGLYCDRAVAPIRLELLSFVGLDAADEGADIATWPLRPGLPQCVWAVPSVAEAAVALAAGGATVAAAVDTPAGPACSGLAPGGIRFELVTAP